MKKVILSLLMCIVALTVTAQLKLPAQVKVDGYSNNMAVWSPEVKVPVSVRYGFRNFSECSLSGANGLGCYPFRTDHEDLK